MKFKLTNAPFLLRKRMLLMIMRTFIFLLCTTVFSFNTENSLAQGKIKIKNDKVISVDEVFDIIMDQTEYSFLYPSELFKNAPKVHLKKGVLSVDKLLHQTLPTGKFNVILGIDNRITIKQKNQNQQKKISGKVTDKAGLPIPGVTVKLKGTSKGVSTDFEGAYTITALDPANVLIFSYVGYTTQEIKVDLKTVINVVLLEEIGELDEVVLIGYGSKKRSEITSAISSLEGTKIIENNVGNISFDRSLAGLLKGVNVTATSGATGAGVNINIRGYTSPFSGSDNNPLFVIDGVPFFTNPVNSRLGQGDSSSGAEILNPLLALNTNDIKSIDVLKDAAATSIYGSRGANGVIIVTTKQGRKNMKPVVSWSSTVSMAKPIDKEDWLNTDEWKQHIDTYIRNSPGIADAPDPGNNDYQDLRGLITRNPDGTYAGLNEAGFGDSNIDYQDILTRSPAVTTAYNFGIRAGSETTTYSMNFGYTDKEGLAPSDYLKQYNIRLALNSDLSKIFETGINLNLGYSNSNVGTGFFNRFSGESFNHRPDLPVYDENGDPIIRQGITRNRNGVIYEVFNATPYGRITANNNVKRGYNVLGSTFLKVNLNENFSVKATLNGGYSLTTGYDFTPATILNASFVGAFEDDSTNFSSESSAQQTKYLNTNLTTDLTANYSNTFGKHTLDALIGYSWLRQYSDASLAFLQDFPDDVILTNPSNANVITTFDSSIVESGLNSFISRVSYNYDSRYFVMASLRADRSSKFGPLNQTAVFPAISGSWNIAKEEFLSESDFVNTLRLRASSGVTGSTNVKDFTYLQGFLLNGRYNGGAAVGISDRLANKEISWEETKEVNLGLDFGFLKNRLRGSIDIYDKKTKDALTGTPIPLEGGQGTYTSNFVGLSNKGFEFQLEGDIIVNGDFKWSASFNIAQNKNKLVSLSNLFNETRNSPWAIGREINLIRGYLVEGIYQDQADLDNDVASGAAIVGDYIIADVDESGDITYDGDGQEILGSSQADYFGGFGSYMSYKGFTLATLFNYSIGGEVLEGGDPFLSPSHLGNRNILRRYSGNNRWSEDNRDAKWPGIGERGRTFASIAGQLPHSTMVYDKTYIRLKNVTLTYNFPNKLISKMGLSKASMFISASNLYTWAKEYPGIDPENGVDPVVVNTRYGNGAGDEYPNSKSWSLGINLNF